MTLLAKGIALRKELIERDPMRTIERGPPCLLFDNGSLFPAATLALRGLARALETTIGTPVQPVSLLHSDRVDPGLLGGVAAARVEPALRKALATGARKFVLLPLFFGPSAALTDYLPARLGRLRAEFPDLQVRLARWLVEVENRDDRRIAAILADQARAVIRDRGLARPRVLLVDHGSPRRAVTEVRDFLGRQLGALLAGDIGPLAVASMERRPGPAYDFCEPTLAGLLARPEFAEGDVVLAPQFLLPGRHAGPEGDVARICAAATSARPRLRIHPAALVGSHPGLLAVLAERYRQAVSGA